MSFIWVRKLLEMSLPVLQGPLCPTGTARPPHCYGYGAGLASGALEPLWGVALRLLGVCRQPAALTLLPQEHLGVLCLSLSLASTASLPRPRGEMLHLPLKKKLLRAFSEAES